MNRHSRRYSGGGISGAFGFGALGGQVYPGMSLVPPRDRLCEQEAGDGAPTDCRDEEEGKEATGESNPDGEQR